MGWCSKYSAAYGSKRKFKRTLFSLISRSKINENSVRLKYYLTTSAAKGHAGGFLHNPIKFS
jgi:hypothetical protein